MKQRKKNTISLFKKFALIITSNLAIVSLCLWLINRYLILPNTNIDGAWVGWLTPTQAYKKIVKNYLPNQIFPISLKTKNAVFNIGSDQLGVHPNTLAKIAQARQIQQKQGLLSIAKIWWTAIRQPKYYVSNLELDQAKTIDLLNKLASAINQPGEKPKFVLKYSGQISSLWLEEGDPGVVLDAQSSLVEIVNFLEQLAPNQTNKPAEISLVVKPIFPRLDKLQNQMATQRAKSFIGLELKLTNQPNHLNIVLNDQDLITVLDPLGGIYLPELEQLMTKQALLVERLPSSAELNYNQNSLIVKSFLPGSPGIQLDIDNTKTAITNFLSLTNPVSQEIMLSIKETTPLVRLADTNNLGINQEIGFGESFFYHSIPSRVHNVELASSIVQNIIVPPGGEFSFVKTLGEVSKKTGFLPAYVIKSGKTELGDGGGVCQVSTTLFRAVLNAGLKVTKRIPHSYRVSYYELDSKPGIDATVYAGETDLRFINDTPAHILIHSSIDKDRLYMNYTIYGTSDGRVTQIVDHQVWGYQPPLPTQNIIDPSLPFGSKKQIDWAAAGINARFTNVIKDGNGQIIREDQYVSHYKPWAAKFLVGPTP